jgi:hypothetical protein
MGCDEVRGLLGEFHDRESTPAARGAVEAHLAFCPACAAVLAAMSELGDLARALTEPEPPDNLWERIALRIEAGPNRWILRRRKIAVLAALVLIVLAVGWRVSRPDRKSEPSTPAAVAVNLSPYLSRQEVAEPGESMSPTEAGRLVAFRVLTAPQLPNGYCLQRCCVCRDECCPLVECAYCRDGERVLVIQCSPGQSVEFGGRPFLRTRMNGKPIQVVQGEDCLAASWQVNGTAVSVIGPRDLAELVRLMAHIDERMTCRP